LFESVERVHPIGTQLNLVGIWQGVQVGLVVADTLHQVVVAHLNEGREEVVFVAFVNAAESALG